MNQKSATLCDESDNYLTLEEVLARVGNPHRSTVWRWVKRGLFPAASSAPGQRRMLWAKSKVDRWIDAVRLSGDVVL